MERVSSSTIHVRIKKCTLYIKTVDLDIVVNIYYSGMLHRGSKPRAGAPDFCPQTALACTPKTLRTGIKDRGKKSQRRDSSNKMFFWKSCQTSSSGVSSKVGFAKAWFPDVSFRMFRFRDRLKIEGSLHVLRSQMWQLPR